MTEEHDVFSVGHNSKNEAAARDLIERLIKHLEPWLDPFADEQSRIDPLSALLDRSDELLSAQSRMPAVIDTAELSAKATDHGAQIATLINKAKKDLKAFKAPFWDGGKAIDGFTNDLVDPLEAAKKVVETRLNAYQRAEREKAQRAADEAAKAQREAEERARKEAAEAAATLETEADLERAIAAESRVAEVVAAAPVPAPDVIASAARVYGSGGASASLTKRWVHLPESIDRAALDLEALRPYLPLDGIEQAIRQFIKDGGRALRGVKIEEALETRLKSK